MEGDSNRLAGRAATLAVLSRQLGYPRSSTLAL
jgi:hypothetical protein